VENPFFRSIRFHEDRNSFFSTANRFFIFPLDVFEEYFHF
jgi:hypothetical protein